MLFQMFTIHTLRLFCYAWHVYITSIHIWQATGLFLICQTCIIGYCLFVFWFLWVFLVTLKMSQSLLEDILHRVTLTKSLAMQPKLLAEQDSVSTFKFFSFFSVAAHLINVNWDEKEKTSSFSILLWIGLSYKGRVQTPTWLRNS